MPCLPDTSARFWLTSISASGPCSSWRIRSCRPGCRSRARSCGSIRRGCLSPLCLEGGESDVVGMAPDGGSADRATAPELPARGVDTGLNRRLAFVSRLAAYARGHLRSLAAIRHRLGVRLLSRVLLFSACLTLILTLLQLYIEDRRDVSALELRFGLISNGCLESLAEHLPSLHE